MNPDQGQAKTVLSIVGGFLFLYGVIAFSHFLGFIEKYDVFKPFFRLIGPQATIISALVSLIISIVLFFFAREKTN